MNAKIIALPQGSDAWLQYRLSKRNASETPAVMGVSPWVTPYQLWQLRTGRREQQVNAAMARGTALEPVARACYERLTGYVMQPLVLEAGDYSASLDGLTLDGQLALEIKCPVRGRESSLWKSVAEGVIPEHYGLQVEHQLMVAGAEQAHLFVYDAETDSGLLVDVLPQPERWEGIRRAWDQFMQHIEQDTPPALSDRDQVQRSDEAWRQAAEHYLRIKREADELAAQLDAAKAALIDLTQAPSEAGYGVTVSRYWKAGAVDYKKVPQLQGLDLEAYRANGREEVRVAVSRG